MAMYLNNLAGYWGLKFEETKNLEDLDEGIRRGEEGVQVSKGYATSPERVKSLRNLALNLHMRYVQTRSVDDNNRSLELMEEAIHVTIAPPAHRLNVVRDAVDILTAQKQWMKARDIARAGVELLPLASTTSLRRADQQDMLYKYYGITSDAVGFALEAGDHPSVAVTLLELGRGVIASHHFQARSDHTELRDQHPAEANELEQFYKTLEVGRSTEEQFVETLASSKARHAASERLEKVLARIRQFPGFERFLLPPMAADLMKVARECQQTIVFVNLAAMRCDALIITEIEITSVPLPGLTRDSVEHTIKQFAGGATMGMLRWLWDRIADPILKRLQITTPCESDAEEDWPRLCWIPTGSLSRLPFHAAGYHSDESKCTVLDRVISSYSVSVGALRYTYENQHRQTRRQGNTKALCIAMPNTPHLSSLPGATTEVNELQKVLVRDPSTSSTLEVEALVNPEHAKVLATLTDNCQILHFAGHGQVHPDDPSQSCLLLADGKGLTVQQLNDAKLHESPPILAYLSACSTAVNNTPQLLDEGIHLMGACQVAGFQNVVGTLWEVSDVFCVQMAVEVYERLVRSGFDPRSVSWAVHGAVRSGRDVESTLRGSSRNVELEDDPTLDHVRDPRLWAAFIHMGI